MSKKTSFYMNDELEGVLDKYIRKYSSLAGTITTLIYSIDTLYRIERRELKNIFTEGETKLMVTNAMSTIYNPQHIEGAILGQVKDTEKSLFECFGVDRKSLLSKLSSLTASQQYALVDLILELRGNEPVETKK